METMQHSQSEADDREWLGLEHEKSRGTDFPVAASRRDCCTGQADQLWS